MKHRLIILAELIVIIAAIVAAVFIFRHPDRHDDKTAQNTPVQSAASQKPACKYFTLTDAKQLLGDGAKAGTNPVYESLGSNVYTSSCTYTLEPPLSQAAAVKKAATLVVRQPKADKGLQSIQSEFGALKPVDAQDVGGYGDSAFWDADKGELNILKNNNWYVLSIGPSTPSQRSLDQAKAMADLLLPKL